MDLKQIAKQVGVSTATVSRVLNDQPGVSAEVRKKVIKAAAEANYRPNQLARGLATSKSQTIGFIVHKEKYSFSDDPFYPFILSGVEDYLTQNGYHILITLLDEKEKQPQKLPIISQRLVDGLILAGPFIQASSIMNLASSEIPFVLVDNSLSQYPVNCVLTDDEGGAYSGVHHLIAEHQHKKIAFLSGPNEWVSNRERLHGYERAMEEFGLEGRVIHADETTIASGEAMLQQALKQWPDLTAVYGVNDSVAIGAIRAAGKLGRSTPRDLAVMGFDDISWAAANQPSLSTVKIFIQRMGYLAAQCLLNNIQQPGLPPTKTLVTTELVLRESCGCQEKSNQ
ncbi:MAG: LacI family transcriptional regulator [Anaerolineaceae bacterium]|jgi:DNA-binding LacI/PurR family transcriptional regulator|nr:MAG: LacI family transcriptional regulator [Anaerolineaceae bacterium]